MTTKNNNNTKINAAISIFISILFLVSSIRQYYTFKFWKYVSIWTFRCCKYISIVCFSVCKNIIKCTFCRTTFYIKYIQIIMRSRCIYTQQKMIMHSIFLLYLHHISRYTFFYLCVLPLSLQSAHILYSVTYAQEWTINYWACNTWFPKIEIVAQGQFYCFCALKHLCKYTISWYIWLFRCVF